VTGLAQLHALVADHLGDDDEPGSVLIGIETDRGPWVQALVATGCTVYPINPLQVSRYRQRHATSGAKSDPGDAHVLAEIVHRPRPSPPGRGRQRAGRGGQDSRPAPIRR
jgi:transposase